MCKMDNFGFLFKLSIICFAIQNTISYEFSLINEHKLRLLEKNKREDILKRYQTAYSRGNHITRKKLEKKFGHNRSKPTINSDFKVNDVCDRCLYDAYTVYCACNNYEFDITDQISHISQELDQNQAPKYFQTFALENGVMTEFPNNSFLDLTFELISIWNPINLQRINRNAFNSTANTVLIFEIDGYNNFQLRNNPPDYDLWNAFSSFVNVYYMWITLAQNEAHEIPDNAFQAINGVQNNLIELIFGLDYNISRIGDYAFSQLPLIDGVIDLSLIPIQQISAHAFEFANNTERYVEINLSECSLTENSFQSQFFIGKNRPLIVYLSYNEIRYIRKELFYDFFESDRRNMMFIDGNPLNCSDVQPFEWIFANKNEYMSRLIYPYCANGTYMWDLNVTVSSNANLLYSYKLYFVNILCILIFKIFFQ